MVGRRLVLSELLLKSGGINLVWRIKNRKCIQFIYFLKSKVCTKKSYVFIYTSIYEIIYLESKKYFTKSVDKGKLQW